MIGATVTAMIVTWDGLVDHEGMWAGYRRLQSHQRVTPPFTWSGVVRVNAVKDPPVFEEGWHAGETATYEGALVFHPQYPSNQRNVLIRIGQRSNPTGVGISAEMRDVRPGDPYGVRTGYESRVRNPIPDPVDGYWHAFTVHVYSHAHYDLWWDGELVADVVEKEPATIDPGPVPVGLRLDFLDIDLGSMTLTENRSNPVAFDHSRFDWYPTVRHNGVVFDAATVRNSSGTPRPPLAVPLKVFTVHYGGAGRWLDTGDTAAELAAIEANHAIPSSKPNEYNSASDSESVTWEWAGPYRAAHSAGENSVAWGHLCVLGLEHPTEAQATLLISGIRRARRQAVDAGYLTPDHTVVPHTHMPGANTPCPGPLYSNPTWWDRISAPLTEPDPGGDSVFQKMIKQTGDPAVWALYSGGYKTWVPDEQTRDFLLYVGGQLEEIPPSRSVMQATGPVMGPLPGGYDAWGNRT